MDSSSSMQSSSGGDEEHDSRADPTSTFFNPTTNLSSLYPSPLLSPSIDPLFLYLDALTRSIPPPSSTAPPPPPPSLPAAPPSSSRSSKKRPRTSRRELTTVLTTDTSNFRAMVQEFTGLPALPFSSSLSRSTLPAVSPFSLYKPFTNSSSSSSSSSPYLPNFLSPSSTDKTPAISNAELLNLLNLQSYLQSSPANLGSTSPMLGVGRALQGAAVMGSTTTAAADNTQTIEVAPPRAGDGGESDVLRWIGGQLGSTEYRAEKETNTVPTSGEATVNSWICSAERRS